MDEDMSDRENDTHQRAIVVVFAEPESCGSAKVMGEGYGQKRESGFGFLFMSCTLVLTLAITRALTLATQSADV